MIRSSSSTTSTPLGRLSGVPSATLSAHGRLLPEAALSSAAPPAPELGSASGILPATTNPSGTSSGSSSAWRTLMWTSMSCEASVTIS
eukprot:CAMPEP_0174753866 /NCGR_PEP_ID=MMETSP1094-20130205/104856_1 /TAXON_ID=156173 /ORGANISM="Chrysochromulina brevifilum, Strain UTEX LB 985" /LENGTH=87 /DNA_ID=CAMNT_0015959685 /DNA_START=73 /DNA_END=333 /DNA_ORIENTATION=+